jgi:Ca2+/Na+ antiporter
MRGLLVACIVAVPVFLALARWNGAVAVFFAIAVLAFVLSTLYWKYSAEDPFAGAIDRRDADLYGDSRARPPSPREHD